MSSKAESILAVSQNYTACVTFLILFGGLVGQVINILVFVSSRQFRKNQSAFYLTVESVVNCIQLLVSCSSRIAINGFNNDLTQTSPVWCRLRQAIATSLTLFAFNIICFAAIDQYLSTSYLPYLRQISTLKAARVLTSVALIVWILHGVPFVALIELRPVTGCSSLNAPFATYVTYVYFLVLSGLLPIFISTVFALLAYLNVRRIVRRQIPVFRRRLEKQLTAMILARVAFAAVSTAPFVINRIFASKFYISPADTVDRAILRLVESVTFSIFFLNFSVSNHSCCSFFLYSYRFLLGLILCISGFVGPIPSTSETHSVEKVCAKVLQSECTQKSS